MFLTMQQLRTLIISPNDLVGEEKSRKKNRFKFFLQRLDGRYLFMVSQLLKHILYVQKLVANTGHSAVVIQRPIAIAARTRTLLVSCCTT